MIIIGQISGKEKLEAKFELTTKLEYVKNFLLFPKDRILTITSGKRHAIQKIPWGMIPFWKKVTQPEYFAPVDGKNHTSFESFKKRIINDPAFRRPIRKSRCIIPADYFIIQENDRAFLFFMKERPFALTGVTDFWKWKIQDKLYEGSAILTIPAYGFFKDVGISRIPMILPFNKCKRWLKPDLHLLDVTEMLRPVDENLVNGYEIDPVKIIKGNNAKDIANPIGDLLRKEDDLDFGKLSDDFKRFRYSKGVTHPKRDIKDEKNWRS